MRWKCTILPICPSNPVSRKPTQPLGLTQWTKFTLIQLLQKPDFWQYWCAFLFPHFTVFQHNRMLHSISLVLTENSSKWFKDTVSRKASQVTFKFNINPSHGFWVCMRWVSCIKYIVIKCILHAWVPWMKVTCFLSSSTDIYSHLQEE